MQNQEDTTSDKKESMGMTYSGSGVDYEVMDPFKRAAQLLARETAGNIADLNFREVEESRGESVYVIETPWGYLGHVVEGLGTKDLIADAMYKRTGELFFGHYAQCCVAMIVNDMITLGVRPVSTSMHFAVGSSNWFKDGARVNDLLQGWKNACDLAMCTWGGGETPTLKDVIIPGLSESSAAAIGFASKDRLIRQNIQDGDRIIIIESSGVHANGLTMMRELAEKLEDGYLTKLPNGRTYGETLLDPTHIYVPAVETCLDAGIDIHYTANITGHGWRKFMRAVEPFTYIIEKLPTQQPIFSFIQERGPVSDYEAYGNLNMGAGFALYVPKAHAQKAVDVVNTCADGRFRAFDAGYIAKTPEKRVIVEPIKDLAFEGKTLGVR